MRTFNTAGTCRPNEHYMVDITERLEIIRGMVAKGDYFCFRSATKEDACQSKNKINTIE